MSFGFFNGFSMFLILFLLVIHLYTISYTLAFIKNLAIKIRIVLWNSVERGRALQDYYHPLAEVGIKINKKVYWNAELVYRTEIIKRHNHHWTNVFWLMLDRYNHVFYLWMEKKEAVKNIILRQPTSMHLHTYVNLMILSFSLAVLVSINFIPEMQLFNWQIILIIGSIIAFVESVFSIMFNFAFFKFYARDLQRIFE